MHTNHQLSIAILADDLTSAADGAAPFVARGLTAAIGRSRIPSQAAGVVAVDSASRSATSAQAFERVASLTRQLAGRDILYKTVDSTLRGHVTQELDACFAASGRTSMVFAPAFPEAGRTTVGGIQLVDGIPVAESSYGRDPVHPARHSALADLVPKGMTNVTLLDALTQEALDAQIASIPEPQSVLWVGSPGMATALARHCAPTATPAPSIAGISGDVLVVVGTANLRSHVQADQLHQAGGVTLLRAPRTREQDPTAVLRQVAQDAAGQLQDPRFGALIATGGDTMEAILDLLDVHAFEILQELDPGFPLGRARLANGHSLLLAMKAGGFGSDDALARAVLRIRGATQLL